MLTPIARCSSSSGITEEQQKDFRGKEQEICCETVSPRNDREALLMKTKNMAA